MSIAALKKAGVRFNLDYQYKKKVKNLKLELAPEQWVRIVDKEREDSYLPMCCGNLSAARDILISVLREGCWIDTDDLATVYRYVIGHDGWEAHRKGKGPKDDPFTLIAWLHQQTKNLIPSQGLPPLPRDPNDVWDVIRSLSRGTQFLDIQRMFEERNPPDEEKVNERGVLYVWWKDKEGGLTHGRPKKDWELDRVKHKSELIQALQLMAPAVRTLYTKLQDLDPGPLEGYAMVDTEEPHKIAEIGRGWAIYPDKAGAEENCKEWKKYYPKTETRVRRCRVSLANGIEWLR